MSHASVQTPDWLRPMVGILEALNEGVVIVDDQVRVIFANEALIRLAGYERGQLQGRTPDSLFPSRTRPVAPTFICRPMTWSICGLGSRMAPGAPRCSSTT